jgi:hypothetical protein
MLAPIPNDVSIQDAVRRAMRKLPAGLVVVRPRDIAPVLGLTDDAFTRHCRQLACTRGWRGDYRFQLDDPQHVEVLVKIVSYIVVAGQRVPEDLRPTFARKQTLPSKARKSIA